MKSGSNKRTLFLLLILGILLAVAYQNFQPDNTTVSQVDTSAQSQEAVDILQKLQAVDLSSSSLSNMAFAYLKDITIPLLNIKVGRDDPFAPTK